jgi:type II secretory pathway pseudopilin PulG
MEEMRTRCRQGGFTLIEVVVSGVILTIASVALAATMAQTTGLAEMPRQEAAARNAIRGIVATLAATPFDKVAALNHNSDFEVQGLTVQPGDADGKCGRVIFEYGPDGDTSFYTVTVRVDWRGRAGDRTIESVHYLANVRGDSGAPTPLEELTGGGQ